jgi:hypothetical protein
MAVLVIQQVAATEEQYRTVNEALDTKGSPPAGLIVHTGGPVADGELRVVDVWESREAFETWVSERLGPAIAEVMGDEAPRPTLEITELYDVIKG